MTDDGMAHWAGQLGSLSKRELTPKQWPLVRFVRRRPRPPTGTKNVIRGQKTLSRGFYEPFIVPLHMLDEPQHMGYPQSRTSVNKSLSLTVSDVCRESANERFEATPSADKVGLEV